VNSVLVATYWELGRRIVEHEQDGNDRAGYGEKLLERLSRDLSAKFGRGFSVVNLETMRLFYSSFPMGAIPQTVTGEFGFPLSWSHYVLQTRAIKKSRPPKLGNGIHLTRAENSSPTLDPAALEAFSPQ
jgi:hypothetical protein